MSNLSDLKPEDLRFGHTSEETALLVEDYPYGFRLRTSIRYWIETTKNGDRFVSQTLNPKTDRWNKPKKSTYIEAGVIYAEPAEGDKHGHIGWTGIGIHANPEIVQHFLAITEGKLSVAQKASVARIIGIAKVFENVTFTIREGASTPEEDAKQAEISKAIARGVAIETHRALEGLA